MSSLQKGAEIWLPCEIRKGPFGNERKVFVRLGATEWFGFVDTEELQENANLVRAVILEVGPTTLTLGIRGHSPTSPMVRIPPAWLIEHGVVAP